MTEYICFLRGINVGGIRITMNDLKSSFIRLGLQNPITYLQTGNIRFFSGTPKEDLRKKIEKTLSLEFSYDAKVMLYEISKLQTIISELPFPYTPDLHRYVLLFSDNTPIKQLLSHDLDPSIEQIAKGNDVLYWQVPKGMTTRTLFAKLITTSAFSQILTVRNVNTLKKIVLH